MDNNSHHPVYDLMDAQAKSKIEIHDAIIKITNELSRARALANKYRETNAAVNIIRIEKKIKELEKQLNILTQ